MGSPSYAGGLQHSETLTKAKTPEITEYLLCAGHCVRPFFKKYPWIFSLRGRNDNSSLKMKKLKPEEPC